LNVPFVLRRALAGTLVLCLLAGCELFKGNEEVLAIINGRVIGMPAGEFFDRYGRADSRSELADGALVFGWTASLEPEQPGGANLDEHICKLRLSADKRGRIRGVQIVYDGPGRKSVSRCGEIFAAS